MCAQLDLSGNKLGPEGAAALAPAIAVSASVTELNLYQNYIKDEGVTAICEALQSNKETKLASLDIGFNSIGPAGAKSVAAMAAVVASLTSLNLAENNLGGETGYVKATKVQGTSFNVGDKVVYEGREMIVSAGKDRDGDIKMKPVDWLSGINAIAKALRVSASLTQVLAFPLKRAPAPCVACSFAHHRFSCA